MKSPRVVVTQVAKVLDAWLRKQTQHTRRAYEVDLREYAKGTKEENWVHAVHELLVAGPVAASAQVEKYLGRIAPVLAQATVSRRLSALRGAVDVARKAGLVTWTLTAEIPKPKTKAQAIATAARSMEGIDLDQLQKIRATLEQDRTMAGLRDRAIIELAATPPYLRRSEIVQLDIEHVNFRKKRVTVIGKGRLSPEQLALSPSGIKALGEWLDVRKGTKSSPVFIRLDRGAKPDQRLSDRSVYAITMDRGVTAGVGKVRPHGLRHHGITELANFIDAKGLPVGEGMKLARHKKEETYRGYIDRTGTLQDQIIQGLDQTAGRR